ncbi:MT12B-like protein [Mya arenaria]|uniref:MT12B-like protein n=1 Tax=Mya arenaria TaxID=6604 RepID=A0ABY7E330_MYAAR|nr:MT12B-like protein [Mya arenaria]
MTMERGDYKPGVPENGAEETMGLLEDQSHDHSNGGADRKSLERCDDILGGGVSDVFKCENCGLADVDQNHSCQNSGTVEPCPKTNGSLSTCNMVSETNGTSSKDVSPLLTKKLHVEMDENSGQLKSVIKDPSPPKPELTRQQSCYDNAPDGGWGWAVTFAAFMVGVILDGISFSFGIFYRELLDHFQESKSPIASILVAVFGCRPVAIFGASLAAVSFFLCAYSPNVRVMIVVYGLLGGAGLGLLYLPSIVSVGHYFKKKRALATGIAVCGSGIGGFVFAPLSEFLIEKYTWKGAMMIISAIVLNGIPIAALLRPLEGSQTYSERKRESKCAERAIKEKLLDGASGHNSSVEKPAKKCCNFDISSIFDFELLKSPTFLVYGMSCFLCMLGFFIPFTFIPDLMVDVGMTSEQGAMIIAIIGILNTVARVFVGWLADRPWADALIINSVALVIGGVSTMFVPMYVVFSGMATYAVVFGISIAVFVSYRSIIVAELLGIEKLTSSFGLVTMCQGLSAFIGAPIAGDYGGAFYLAGIAIALSGVICFPLRAISRWEKRREEARCKKVNEVVFISDMELEITSKS